MRGATVQDAKDVRCPWTTDAFVEESDGSRWEGLQQCLPVMGSGRIVHQPPAAHAHSFLTRLSHPAILLGWQQILAYGRSKGGAQREPRRSALSRHLPCHVTSSVGLWATRTASHEQFVI